MVGTNQQGTVGLGAIRHRAGERDAEPGDRDLRAGPRRRGWPDPVLGSLPPTRFSDLQVNQAGPASPGWTPGYYFTGNISSANGTFYAMALDGNGVPVWYQQVAAHSGGAVNVELLPNDTIAWTGNPSIYGIGLPPTGDLYSAFNLDTQSLSSLPAAVPPTDLPRAHRTARRRPH